ncbi:hypothetical protein YC2023_064537 [Brassica napus]
MPELGIAEKIHTSTFTARWPQVFHHIALAPKKIFSVYNSIQSHHSNSQQKQTLTMCLTGCNWKVDKVLIN